MVISRILSGVGGTAVSITVSGASISVTTVGGCVAGSGVGVGTAVSRQPTAKTRVKKHIAKKRRLEKIKSDLGNFYEFRLLCPEFLQNATIALTKNVTVLIRSCHKRKLLCVFYRRISNYEYYKGRSA